MEIIADNLAGALPLTMLKVRFYFPAKLVALFLISFTTCMLMQGQTNKNASAISEYVKLINYYRYYKQDSATYYAEKGLAFAERTKDSNGIAAILTELGMIDDNKGKFEESEKKYLRAVDIYKKTGNQKGIATATIRTGVVQLRNGNYDKAIGYFLEALKVAEKNGNTFGVMEANYSISWAHLDHHNEDLALKYLKIAEEINESLPFSNLSLNIYNHFGVIYRNKGDYRKAKYYLEKGIKLSNKIEYQGLNITLINSLASVYSKEGDNEKAIALQKKALERARAIDNYLRELQTLSGLAKSYGNENPRQAIFYLKQAVELARKKGAHKQEMRFLKILTDLYQSQGNYKEAFLMKNREHTLADSFFYKTTSEHIAGLKAEYELSKSNARVKELSYVNNKHQLELEKSNIIRNVTFAGISLLLIILGLLLNQYRIKQHSNKEISQKNQKLQHLVDEKEWLLKEVHHRVKNNLHTVMSLLESQSVYLENDALTAIRDSQHRVYAMSLIHQKLYQTDNVTSIDMSVYLPELVNYLRDSFDTRQRIRFRLQIEPIQLDVSQAIPMGLILNEAITNSIKYAFQGSHENIIDIRMTQATDGFVTLTVADNGIGLPENLNKNPTGSLGMKLMKGLSEDIQARFTIESINGTRITIKFMTAAVLENLHAIPSPKKMEHQL